MTFSRIRVALCSVLAALLAVAWTSAAGQAPPPGRETSGESVASYALSQQMPVDPGGHPRHAAERPALLRARQRQAGPPRRAPARHQGGLGARRRRPAGAGALRRTHAVRGHAQLSAGRSQRVPGDARRRHRTGRQRANELRRHAVHPARADRRARGARPRAARARGLGPGRDVRRRRHRAPARHHSLGVAHAPRRRRADHGQAAPGAAGGIALRRPVADRQARDSRARDSANSCCASTATGIARI